MMAAVALSASCLSPGRSQCLHRSILDRLVQQTQLFLRLLSLEPRQAIFKGLIRRLQARVHLQS